MTLERYNVKTETISTIGEFSILWCLFEQSFLNTQASPAKLIDWSKNQPTSEKLSDLCTCIREESIKYLGNTEMKTIISRVCSPTHRVIPEHKDQIYAFLNNDTSQKQLVGCMLYIQRIRNNLFHGLKEVYTLNEQSKMFESINRLFEYFL